jgi:transposase
MMRKRTVSAAERMAVAIRQEIGRNDEARYDHRLHGVLLVANGRSARQAAQWLNERDRTVQRWGNQCEEAGFAGLQDRERPGRPRRLSDGQGRRLQRDVRRNPCDVGFPQTLWDGTLLAEHLHPRYHVELGVRQWQRLFTQRGLRLRKPKPVIAKADPAAQGACKKTAPTGQKARP